MWELFYHSDGISFIWSLQILYHSWKLVNLREGNIKHLGDLGELFFFIFFSFFFSSDTKHFTGFHSKLWFLCPFQGANCSLLQAHGHVVGKVWECVGRNLGPEELISVGPARVQQRLAVTWSSCQLLCHRCTESCLWHFSTVRACIIPNTTGNCF